MHTLFLWPRELAGRAQPSMNQEVSPYQTPNLARTLFLDFPVSKTVRNKLLLFISHPVYGIVIAGWMHGDKSRYVSSVLAIFHLSPTLPDTLPIIQYSSWVQPPRGLQAGDQRVAGHMGISISLVPLSCLLCQSQLSLLHKSYLCSHWALCSYCI